MSIRIQNDLDGVSGAMLKQFYIDSDFDNGRTAEQHETAFRNSVVRLAFDGDTGLAIGGGRRSSVCFADCGLCRSDRMTRRFCDAHLCIAH